MLPLLLLLLSSLLQPNLVLGTTYVEYGPDFDSLGWEYNPGTYNYINAPTLQDCQDRVTDLGWVGYIYRFPRDCYRFKKSTPSASLSLKRNHREACPAPGTANPAIPSPAYKKKRSSAAAKKQSSFIGGKVCPIGEQACPLKKGFGCINVKENLASCGGCIGGAGIACSELPGVDEVSCRVGKCKIHSCARGWSLSSKGECVKL